MTVTESSPSQNATVIGAGIVGMCCALYLQRAGFAVTVVDREAPGEGCSRGNAGVFGVGSCVPLAMPGALRRLPRSLLNGRGSPSIRIQHLHHLAPWIFRFLLSSRPRQVEAIATALRSLQLLLYEAYAPLLEDAGAEAMVRRSGKLHAYTSQKAFARDRRARDIQRRHGVDLRELSGAEARELEPALGPAVTNAAFFPEVSHCTDPYRLVRAFANLFLRTGGRLVRDKVTGFEFGGRGPCRLVASRGSLSVDTVVLASGAWSAPLMRQLGSPIPLESERGYHVMLPEPQVPLRIPTHIGGRGVVLTPMAEGLRVAGLGELAGLEAPPNGACIDRLLTAAREILPDLRDDNGSTWMGHRPAMPDSLPVIGRSPRYRNVFFALGHGHVGLGLAAITGRLIAELAAGRPPFVDITPFSAARFQLRRAVQATGEIA